MTCTDRVLGTRKAHRAARDHAAVIADVGIDPAEAIRIVEAALGHAPTPYGPTIATPLRP
ncbi:hypothetical protein [Actinomadura sp. 9N407]|uniref:hypothetical protein n=1 Tax=Actinomadura sp. 9N407 TaxID=3375154 RepID=UPI0037A0B36D